jgi:hypothetical protein
MFTQRIEYEAQLKKYFKTMFPNEKKNTKYHLKKLSSKFTIPFSHINLKQERI